MAVNLATKFYPFVDEKFSQDSKKSMVTNDDFDWNGAKTVKVYKVTTAQMSDYDRSGENTSGSRYGDVKGLDATTEDLTLTKDRSFTFAIDKLDSDETVQQLQAASALERQIREVVIPEIDSYVYGVMCEKAGHLPEAVSLTAENVYEEILKASQMLDDNDAPETDRVLIVTPATYTLMKKCSDIVMETNIGDEMRRKGVISMLDGASVVKVPSARLPEGFGFMLCHPSATVAPTKLEDYKIHEDPPGISGSLVEGRINYDAFVLENKAKAVYYQAVL
ncbi:MAG: hypothetical protein E7508_07355 [Ruminococcus sp.]|nr:hypothetical protein [Ruminococcus sp.]